jgi:hypothetical protein
LAKDDGKDLTAELLDERRQEAEGCVKIYV